MDSTVTFTSNQAPDAGTWIVPSENPSNCNEADRLRIQLARLAALTDLIARLESADNLRDACQKLADLLRDHLSVEQVFVGLCREGSLACQLTAISGVPAFDPRTSLTQAAQAALQESIARRELVCWPAADPTFRGGLLAHRQYAEAAGVAAIVSSPLRDAAGRLCGACMVTTEFENVDEGSVTSFLRAAENPVASALNLVARARKGSLYRASRAARRALKECRGRVIVGAIALLALILCLPVAYRPKYYCTIEPVTRRFVAAPFDGPLEKAFVQPGDLVEKGQLLARMDGREVRWELAGTRAELHRAAKQRAGHLATHESGDAEIARYEVDRLEMRIELLEHRDQNVDIRSPVAGVVVSGDLEDAEGMPLDVGQTLFEVAPLDDMVVEVSIAEDDFAYIRAGMPVTIRLDAFPLRNFMASIERIHPRAELRDDAHVFIAEVRLEHPANGLRPGMRGTARVEADRYTLGWNLFHRPLIAALTWLGW
jgi:multidrug efflux pump subunit AcrA (membrane-fusion protein)